MNERELRAAYAAHLAARPASRAECPEPEQLRGLVERQGPEAERLALLDHVMGCAACRAEFDLLRTVASSRPDAAPRRWTVPFAAAAALALLFSGALLFQQLAREPGRADGLRGGAELIQLLEPRGKGAGLAPRFVWRSLPGAPRYAIELFTPAGDRLFIVEGTDTVTTLPDSVALTPGQSYHWWVTAQWPDGRERRSAPAAFTP